MTIFYRPKISRTAVPAPVLPVPVPKILKIYRGEDGPRTSRPIPRTPGCHKKELILKGPTLNFVLRDLRIEWKIFCSKLFSQTKEFDPKMVLVKVLDQFSRFFQILERSSRTIITGSGPEVTST